MILNNLIILILSVESFAYDSPININDKILNGSNKKLSLKFGVHEQDHRIAGYFKDNLTDSLKGMWWQSYLKLFEVLKIIF